MPHPINAPRFRVVKTQDGMFVAIRSTDLLNWFPVSSPIEKCARAVDVCNAWLAFASSPTPVGETVWRDDGTK